MVKGDLATEVRKMKEQPGEDMVIMGSGSIVSQLTQKGLIDEYQVVVVPVVIGEGKTMFDGVKEGSARSEEDAELRQRETLHALRARSVQRGIGGFMGRRAESLADRIEQGAAELASFAEGLSEKDWQTPGTSGNDRRPMGVLVHHVAYMYPIEIDVVKAVAGGKSVMDVTWEAVAGINSKHASDNRGHEGGCSRPVAEEQPRGRCRGASAHGRRARSGRALLLNYGAPVTAQFVIEDHPLRHPWHHLARIRKTLGR